MIDTILTSTEVNKGEVYHFDYPSVKIYWDNGINSPTDTLCFVGFNHEKEGSQRVCIGAYCDEEEDNTYYRPYFTVERSRHE